MHGRWRLFRHDAAREGRIGPWAFLGLYVAALLIGTVSALSFGTVVFWPANAVMIAAVLMLKRPQAVSVFLAGIALNVLNNLLRGDQMPFFAINVILNAVEVVTVSLVARRVCGAALDLRRPRRLMSFGVLAVAPSVAVVTTIAISLAVPLRGYTLDQTLFGIQRYFMVETLGAIIVTPTLLLLGRRPPGETIWRAPTLEAVVLVSLLFAMTAAVFFQTLVSSTFLLVPLLLLVAFRLTPSCVAVSLIGVAVISGAATATGHGAMALSKLPDIPALFGPGGVMAHLTVYYIFMLTVVVSALPISTVTTERRRLMASLRARTATALEARRRAERSDAAKSRFLALMSHEMRTPLNCIMGYAQVMADDYSLPKPARDRSVAVGSAGERLLAMIDDVLEASSEEDALHMSAVRMRDVVETAVASRLADARAKGLTLDVEVRPAADVGVLADQRRLSMAVCRLIDNAIKFTTSGGVTVRVEQRPDAFRLSVSDTGCGLDTGEIERMFELFEQGDASITRRHGGSGVGLAVARRQARLMGGDIEVESRPGAGATFTLVLPLEMAEPVVGAPIKVEAVEVAEAAAPTRILIVDDHPANREVARLMLTAMGCESDQAEDGDEAISMARAGGYDLILMDVRMPRVDGLTATMAIRALEGPAARTPILAVTADAMPEDAARCLASGMNGHLAKPISFHGLAAAMNDALAASADPDWTGEQRRATA
jgi:signal transduction histidine kinase/ActR/RegA family two-component response regulator